MGKEKEKRLKTFPSEDKKKIRKKKKKKERKQAEQRKEKKEKKKEVTEEEQWSVLRIDISLPRWFGMKGQPLQTDLIVERFAKNSMIFPTYPVKLTVSLCSVDALILSVALWCYQRPSPPIIW